ncbi:mucin-2-like isoform X2 [Topomyia yanbarensis]|uniref:mucin-2-like isoform X2 n=1 Tax=Topomyia yanbarensis TaxID=2498891 RepID=UPI00273C145B|nr:mucin-2-like isoform X2 [Topomyia yanbarensis]
MALSGARLHVLEKDSNETNREIAIRTSQVRFGSHFLNTIRLKADSAKRLHCKIFAKNEKVIIANYSVEYPISVDGEIVLKRSLLSDGSILDICGTRFRWQFDESKLTLRLEKVKKFEQTPTSSQAGKRRRTTIIRKKLLGRKRASTEANKRVSKKGQKTPTYTLPKNRKLQLKNIRKRFTVQNITIGYLEDESDDAKMQEENSAFFLHQSSPTPHTTPIQSQNNTPFYTPELDKENATPVTLRKTPCVHLENSAMMVLSYTPTVGTRSKNIQKTAWSSARKGQIDTYLTPKKENVSASVVTPLQSSNISKAGNSMYLIDLTTPGSCHNSYVCSPLRERNSSLSSSVGSSAGLIDLITPSPKKVKAASSAVMRSTQKGLLKSALKNASRTPQTPIVGTPKNVPKISIDDQMSKSLTYKKIGRTPMSATKSKIRRQIESPIVSKISSKTPVSDRQEDVSKKACSSGGIKETPESEEPVMTTDELFDTLLGRQSIKKTYGRKSESPKKIKSPLVIGEEASELPKTDIDLWVESVVASSETMDVDSLIKKPNRTTQIRSSQYSDITPHDSFIDGSNVPVANEEQQECKTHLSTNELENMTDKPSFVQSSRQSHTPFTSKIVQSLGNKRQTIGTFFSNMFGKLTVSPVTRVSITDEIKLSHEEVNLPENDSDGSEEVYHDSETDHYVEVAYQTENVETSSSPKLRHSLRNTRKHIGSALTSLNTSRPIMIEATEIDESLLLNDTCDADELAEGSYDLTDLSSRSTTAQSVETKKESGISRCDSLHRYGTDLQNSPSITDASESSTPAKRIAQQAHVISPLAVPLVSTPTKSCISQMTTTEKCSTEATYDSALSVAEDISTNQNNSLCTNNVNQEVSHPINGDNKSKTDDGLLQHDNQINSENAKVEKTAVSTGMRLEKPVQMRVNDISNISGVNAKNSSPAKDTVNQDEMSIDHVVEEALIDKIIDTPSEERNTQVFDQLDPSITNELDPETVSSPAEKLVSMTARYGQISRMCLDDTKNDLADTFDEEQTEDHQSSTQHQFESPIINESEEGIEIVTPARATCKYSFESPVRCGIQEVTTPKQSSRSTEKSHSKIAANEITSHECSSTVLEVPQSTPVSSVKTLLKSPARSAHIESTSPTKLVVSLESAISVKIADSSLTPRQSSRSTRMSGLAITVDKLESEHETTAPTVKELYKTPRSLRVRTLTSALQLAASSDSLSLTPSRVSRSTRKSVTPFESPTATVQVLTEGEATPVPHVRLEEPGQKTSAQPDAVLTPIISDETTTENESTKFVQNSTNSSAVSNVSSKELENEITEHFKVESSPPPPNVSSIESEHESTLTLKEFFKTPQSLQLCEKSDNTSKYFDMPTTTVQVHMEVETAPVRHVRLEELEQKTTEKLATVLSPLISSEMTNESTIFVRKSINGISASNVSSKKSEHETVEAVTDNAQEHTDVEFSPAPNDSSMESEHETTPTVKELLKIPRSLRVRALTSALQSAACSDNTDDSFSTPSRVSRSIRKVTPKHFESPTATVEVCTTPVPQMRLEALEEKTQAQPAAMLTPIIAGETSTENESTVFVKNNMNTILASDVSSKKSANEMVENFETATDNTQELTESEHETTPAAKELFKTPRSLRVRTLTSALQSAASSDKTDRLSLTPSRILRSTRISVTPKHLESPTAALHALKEVETTPLPQVRLEEPKQKTAKPPAVLTPIISDERTIENESTIFVRNSMNSSAVSNVSSNEPENVITEPREILEELEQKTPAQPTKLTPVISGETTIENESTLIVHNATSVSKDSSKESEHETTEPFETVTYIVQGPTDVKSSPAPNVTSSMESEHETISLTAKELLKMSRVSCSTGNSVTLKNFESPTTATKVNREVDATPLHHVSSEELEKETPSTHFESVTDIADVEVSPSPNVSSMESEHETTMKVLFKTPSRSRQLGATSEKSDSTPVASLRVSRSTRNSVALKNLESPTATVQVRTGVDVTPLPAVRLEEQKQETPAPSEHFELVTDIADVESSPAPNVSSMESEHETSMKVLFKTPSRSCQLGAISEKSDSTPIAPSRVSRSTRNSVAFKNIESPTTTVQVLTGVDVTPLHPVGLELEKETPAPSEHFELVTDIADVESSPAPNVSSMESEHETTMKVLFKTPSRSCPLGAISEKSDSTPIAPSRVSRSTRNSVAFKNIESPTTTVQVLTGVDVTPLHPVRLELEKETPAPSEHFELVTDIADVESSPAPNVSSMESEHETTMKVLFKTPSRSCQLGATSEKSDSTPTAPSRVSRSTRNSVAFKNIESPTTTVQVLTGVDVTPLHPVRLELEKETPAPSEHFELVTDIADVESSPAPNVSSMESEHETTMKVLFKTPSRSCQLGATSDKSDSTPLTPSRVSRSTGNSVTRKHFETPTASVQVLTEVVTTSVPHVRSEELKQKTPAPSAVVLTSLISGDTKIKNGSAVFGESEHQTIDHFETVNDIAQKLTDVESSPAPNVNSIEAKHKATSAVKELGKTPRSLRIRTLTSALHSTVHSDKMDSLSLTPPRASRSSRSSITSQHFESSPVPVQVLTPMHVKSEDLEQGITPATSAIVLTPVISDETIIKNEPTVFARNSMNVTPISIVSLKKSGGETTEHFEMVTDIDQEPTDVQSSPAPNVSSPRVKELFKTPRSLRVRTSTSALQSAASSDKTDNSSLTPSRISRSTRKCVTPKDYESPMATVQVLKRMETTPVPTSRLKELEKKTPAQSAVLLPPVTSGEPTIETESTVFVPVHTEVESSPATTISSIESEYETTPTLKELFKTPRSLQLGATSEKSDNTSLSPLGVPRTTRNSVTPKHSVPPTATVQVLTEVVTTAAPKLRLEEPDQKTPVHSAAMLTPVTAGETTTENESTVLMQNSMNVTPVLNVSSKESDYETVTDIIQTLTAVISNEPEQIMTPMMKMDILEETVVSDVLHGHVTSERQNLEATLGPDGSETKETPVLKEFRTSKRPLRGNVSTPVINTIGPSNETERTAIPSKRESYSSEKIHLADVKKTPVPKVIPESEQDDVMTPSLDVLFKTPARSMRSKATTYAVTPTTSIISDIDSTAATPVRVLRSISTGKTATSDYPDSSYTTQVASVEGTPIPNVTMNESGYGNTSSLEILFKTPIRTENVKSSISAKKMHVSVESVVDDPALTPFRKSNLVDVQPAAVTDRIELLSNSPVVDCSDAISTPYGISKKELAITPSLRELFKTPARSSDPDVFQSSAFGMIPMSSEVAKTSNKLEDTTITPGRPTRSTRKVPLVITETTATTNQLHTSSEVDRSILLAIEMPPQISKLTSSTSKSNNTLANVAEKLTPISIKASLTASSEVDESSSDVAAESHVPTLSTTPARLTRKQRVNLETSQILINQTTSSAICANRSARKSVVSQSHSKTSDILEKDIVSDLVDLPETTGLSNDVSTPNNSIIEVESLSSTLETPSTARTRQSVNSLNEITATPPNDANGTTADSITVSAAEHMTLTAQNEPLLRGTPVMLVSEKSAPVKSLTTSIAKNVSSLEIMADQSIIQTPEVLVSDISRPFKTPVSHKCITLSISSTSKMKDVATPLSVPFVIEETPSKDTTVCVESTHISASKREEQGEVNSNETSFVSPGLLKQICERVISLEHEVQALDETTFNSISASEVVEHLADSSTPSLTTENTTTSGSATGGTSIVTTKRKLYTKNSPEDRTPEGRKSIVVRAVSGDEYLNIVDQISNSTEKTRKRHDSAHDKDDTGEMVRKVLPNRSSRRKIKSLAEENLAGASPEPKFVKPKSLENNTKVDNTNLSENEVLELKELLSGRRKVMFNDQIQVKEINSPALVGDIIKKVSARGRGRKAQRAVEVIVRENYQTIKPSTKQHQVASHDAEEATNDKSFGEPSAPVAEPNDSSTIVDKIDAPAPKRSQRGAQKKPTSNVKQVRTRVSKKVSLEDVDKLTEEDINELNSDKQEQEDFVKLGRSRSTKKTQKEVKSKTSSYENAAIETGEKSKIVEEGKTTTPFEDISEREDDRDVIASIQKRSKRVARKKNSSSKQIPHSSNESLEKPAGQLNTVKAHDDTNIDSKIDDIDSLIDPETNKDPSDTKTKITRRGAQKSKPAKEMVHIKKPIKPSEEKDERQDIGMNELNDKSVLVNIQDTITANEISDELPVTTRPRRGARNTKASNNTKSQLPKTDAVKQTSVVTDDQVEELIVTSRSRRGLPKKDTTVDKLLPEYLHGVKPSGSIDGIVDSSEISETVDQSKEVPKKSRPAKKTTAKRSTRTGRGIASKADSAKDDAITNLDENSEISQSAQPSSDTDKPAGTRIVEGSIVLKAAADSTSQDDTDPAPTKRAGGRAAARSKPGKSKLFDQNKATLIEEESTALETSEDISGSKQRIVGQNFKQPVEQAPPAKVQRKGRQKTKHVDNPVELHQTIEESLNESHMVKTLLSSSHTSTPLLKTSVPAEVEKSHEVDGKGSRNRGRKIVHPIIAALVEEESTLQRRSPRGHRGTNDANVQESIHDAESPGTPVMKRGRGRASAKSQQAKETKDNLTQTEKQQTTPEHMVPLSKTEKRKRGTQKKQDKESKITESGDNTKLPTIQEKEAELSEKIPKRARRAPTRMQEVMQNSSDVDSTQSSIEKDTKLQPSKSRAGIKSSATSKLKDNSASTKRIRSEESVEIAEIEEEEQPKKRTKTTVKAASPPKKDASIPHTSTEQIESPSQKRTRRGVKKAEPVDIEIEVSSPFTTNRKRPVRSRK